MRDVVTRYVDKTLKTHIDDERLHPESAPRLSGTYLNAQPHPPHLPPRGRQCSEIAPVPGRGGGGKGQDGRTGPGQPAESGQGGPVRLEQTRAYLWARLFHCTHF